MVWSLVLLASLGLAVGVWNDPPPLKARRLASIGSGHYVSTNALEAIVKDIRQHGIPDASSASSIRRARTAVATWSTPYGPVLQSVDLILDDGTIFKLPYQHPMAAIHHAIETSPAFASMVLYAYRKQPCGILQPWRLIFYADEIVPGNQMKRDNKRKAWGIYVSIAEFGMEILCNEQAWFVMSILRSETVGKVSGGVSHVFKVCMQPLFDGGAHHMANAGITVDLDGEVVLLFITLGVIIADLAALFPLWCCKAGGTRVCMFCKNCVDHKSELVASDVTGTLVYDTELDIRKYVPNTDAAVIATVRELARLQGTMTKTRFGQFEQSRGFNHSLYNILLCEQLVPLLHPISQTMVDWMHIFVVSGLFQIDMGCLVTFLVAQRISWDTWHEFMQGWALPRQFCKNSNFDFFNRKNRVKHKHGEFKCDAGEALCIYQILAHFVMTRVGGLGPLACTSFLLLCDVLDLLLLVGRGCVDADTLDRAISAYLHAFQAAWGESEWVSKHHFAMHLPSMLRRFGFLLSCFTHERKHKMLKRHANPLVNTAWSWETSVMERVINDHFKDLDNERLFDYRTPLTLLHPHPAPPKMLAAVREQFQHAAAVQTSADVAVSKFSVCHARDVVFFTADGELNVGEVWFHCDVDGAVLSCVSRWHVVARQPSCFQCSIRDAPRLVRTDTIAEIATYRKQGDHATVLLPATLRR